MSRLESGMNASLVPMICDTAERSPTAKSPWPARIARAPSLIVFREVLSHIRGLSHATHEPFVERLGRVHTAVAQEVIHCDHLRDDGDVLSRIQEHANQGKLDVEDRRGLGVEARAVDDCRLVPFLELNDDLDALLLPNGTDAEDSGDVDQPDAPNLHVVTLELVATPDDDIVAAPI